MNSTFPVRKAFRNGFNLFGTLKTYLQFLGGCATFILRNSHKHPNPSILFRTVNHV